MIVWACSSFHVPSFSLFFYCFLGLQCSFFSHFYSSLCQTFLLSFFPMVSRAFNPLISFDCDLCLSIFSSHHYFSFLIFFFDSLIDLSEAQCSKTNSKWVSFYSLIAFACSWAFVCDPQRIGIPISLPSYARGKCRGAGQNFWF